MSAGEGQRYRLDLMVGVIVLGALVLLALVIIAVLGGRRPSAAERGGFEQHPGVGGGWPGSPS